TPGPHRRHRVPPPRHRPDRPGRSEHGRRPAREEQAEQTLLVHGGRGDAGFAPTSGRRTEEARMKRPEQSPRRAGQTRAPALRAVGLAVALGAACGAAAAAPALAAPAAASATAPTTSVTAPTASVAAHAQPAAASAAGADAAILAGDDGPTVLERVSTYATHLE